MGTLPYLNLSTLHKGLIMSIAAQLKKTILTQCPSTFSLYAGYGMKEGEYVRFPQGVQLLDKRDTNGRCIKAVYKYADDSKLVYKCSKASEDYTLTVEGA